jgi:hypothetical protein
MLRRIRLGRRSIGSSSDGMTLKKGREMTPKGFGGFFDKSTKPADADLAKALGAAIGLWNELRRLVGEHFAPLTEEWVFSGKSHGWSLRLFQKKRAVLYLKPIEGYFRVSFAFGEKASQAALESDLPASVLKLIGEAPKYPEGRAVRMDIKNARDVRIALKLARIKMAS